LREIKMLLNDETIKLNAKAQTNSLDIVPEKTHLGPKKILNRSSAHKIIIPISKTTVNRTKIRIEVKSFLMLIFNLFFSDTRCNKTLAIEDAIRARGIDKSSFD